MVGKVEQSFAKQWNYRFIQMKRICISHIKCNSEHERCLSSSRNSKIVIKGEMLPVSIFSFSHHVSFNQGLSIYRDMQSAIRQALHIDY